MKFLDLCAGIGGFRIGMEAAGHECIGFSEIDPYCCAVYNRHWPGTLNLGDLRAVPPGLLKQLGADCWTAGFPCQGWSVAGKRKGTDDHRNLWPTISRLVRVVRPRFLVLENVPEILEFFIHEIVGQLAQGGYCVQWDVVRCTEFGAWQTRDRLFAVAIRDCLGCQESYRVFDRDSRTRFIAEEGLMERVPRVSRGRSGRVRPIPDGGIHRMADGLSADVDRLRALGNAVVPQVVQWIAERL